MNIAKGWENSHLTEKCSRNPVMAMHHQRSISLLWCRQLVSHCDDDYDVICDLNVTKTCGERTMKIGQLFWSCFGAKQMTNPYWNKLWRTLLTHIGVIRPGWFKITNVTFTNELDARPRVAFQVRNQYLDQWWHIFFRELASMSWN